MNGCDFPPRATRSRQAGGCSRCICLHESGTRNTLILCPREPRGLEKLLTFYVFKNIQMWTQKSPHQGYPGVMLEVLSKILFSSLLEVQRAKCNLKLLRLSLGPVSTEGIYHTAQWLAFQGLDTQIPVLLLAIGPIKERSSVSSVYLLCMLR